MIKKEKDRLQRVILFENLITLLLSKKKKKKREKKKRVYLYILHLEEEKSLFVYPSFGRNLIFKKIAVNAYPTLLHLVAINFC